MRSVLGLGAAIVVLGGLLVACSDVTTPPLQATDVPTSLPPEVLRQIELLEEEQRQRTPAQLKMGGDLVRAIKRRHGDPIISALPNLRDTVEVDTEGRVAVDVRATVDSDLLDAIDDLGGEVVNNVPRFDALRLLLSLDALEDLSEESAVISVRRASLFTTNKTNVSQGDVAHRANVARSEYGVDGSGVVVGVISDGAPSATVAALQSTGDLPSGAALEVLSAGTGSEGTAMMEIVHDLAPGAKLKFATAIGGEATMAANILALREAGADIIVDDVYYYPEGAFQDDLIAQAVNQVTAEGALYFSSAGNSGNLNDGTSGVWEGDFKAAPSQQVHDFGGGVIGDVVKKDPDVFTLKWSEPLTTAGADYNLYLLSSDLTVVFDASTDAQDGSGGNDDPFEFISSVSYDDSGNVLVILKKGGGARYLHLNANGGTLTLATAGQVSGHAAAANAIAVAAVGASANTPFVGGSANPVENFSSDGPRRVFFEANGTPITQGNFLATGGALRDKPDLAAADGVHTATPGFDPFFGTSAAAPHAAAIAALVLERSPEIAERGDSSATAVVRELLQAHASLDIEAEGQDRDSGYGVIMADRAVDPCEGLSCAPAELCFEPSACNTTSATCTSEPSAKGTPCDDGNLCNGEEVCDGQGACEEGHAPQCDDDNPCTTDWCDSMMGCRHQNASGDCDDGDECTTEDSCNQGECRGGLAPSCDEQPGCSACVCPEGTVKDAGVCIPMNPCDANNGGCDVLTSCTQAANGVSCGPCPSGYTGSGAAGCLDVNECVTNNGGCDVLTACTNMPGGRTCGQCPPGYSGTGASGCTDINECATNNGGCDALTTCVNAPGSRSCGACPVGYSGSGTVGCQDVDECSVATMCDALTTCLNVPGAYNCGPCPSGYDGTGKTGCVDVDECETDNGGCDPLVTCSNNEGSHGCGLCPFGYDGTGATGCVDIDECTTNNGGCDPVTECVNSSPGFSCGSCPQGYLTVGLDTCVDIDECATSNGGCDPLVVCTNSDGAHQCGPCPAGYSGTGSTGCVDIDECATGNGGCDPLVVCSDLPGGRVCGSCPSGYEGDGETGCIDVDECTTGNGGCDSLTSCVNTLGSRTCGNCPSGYSGDGYDGCVDTNECATSNGGCDLVTSCVNTPGSRTCGNCPGGFTGDGYSGCVDINECADNNGGCGSIPCNNSPGGFQCGCTLGASRCENGAVEYCDGGGFWQATTSCHYGCGTGANCLFSPSCAGECLKTFDIKQGSACLVRDSGQLVCWGPANITPYQVPADEFLSFSFGAVYSCGVRSDGSLRCFDYNTGDRPAPTGPFVDVEMGWTMPPNGVGWVSDRACGLRTDGTVSCWDILAASTSSCQRRGDGSYDCPIPALGEVTTIGGQFFDIDASYKDFCGVRVDGSLECWGYGLISSIPPPTGSFQKVAVGADLACAIRDDSTVACWGNLSNFGWYPTAPNDQPYEDICMNGDYACGVRTDGSVRCWGQEGGQTPPDGAFAHIRCGSRLGPVACAERRDGGVICFGGTTGGMDPMPDCMSACE